MLLAGGALIAVALIGFFASILDYGAEKSRADKYVADGGEAKNFQWKTRSSAMDFVVFGGIGVGLSLCYMGLKRRGRTNPNFVVGADEKADAPLGTEFIGSQSFALVSTTGADFLVNVTPSMTGEVLLDNQVVPLPQFVQQRGASFSLGDRGRVKIDCGESSFLVSATPKPRTFPAPFLVWRWSEQAYTVGTAIGLLLFLLMIFSVPPDPKSLSLDLFNADSRFVNFLIKPPEEKEEEIPEWLKKKGPDEQGGKGKRHKGEEGKMGKKTSKNKEGLYGLKGPKDKPRPTPGQEARRRASQERRHPRRVEDGRGSHLASIFGRDTAAGMMQRTCWAASSATRLAKHTAWVVLVWSAPGPRWWYRRRHHRLGNFGTIGKGGGGGSGSGYGRGAGGLGGRRARAPDVIPGQANVRGSLDKEIIRRIIRRHINEVKYCYETELTKKADLAGRISVQFTIAATGTVIASVLQSSTMGNIRVENCVVQAVRRWEFPKPLGGGIVIVSYPFNFTAVARAASSARDSTTEGAAMGRYLKAILTLGLILPACDAFVCSQERIKAIEIANKGVEAFKNNLYDSAERELRLSMQTDPTYEMPTTTWERCIRNSASGTKPSRRSRERPNEAQAMPTSSTTWARPILRRSIWTRRRLRSRRPRSWTPSYSRPVALGFGVRF